ncbi:MAG TPA: electron transfer flavoprotein subunit alpha/FixB family protein [Desulfomonilia bacterium]
MFAVILTESGCDSREPAALASLLGADMTMLLSLPDDFECNPEALMNNAVILFKELGPDAIIFHETSSSSGMAAFLAAKLGASCFTTVTGINMKSGSPRLLRPFLGGKAVIEVIPKYPAIISIMQGVFKTADTTPLPPASDLPYPSLGEITLEYGIKSLEIFNKDSSETGLPITEADVIVSAGRGIGKPENLELIRTLAGLFSRSAVAGSRLVIDAGWLPYRNQVGLTGKTVRPKLYIACGISGSPQHIAGMKDSSLIVSINKDPHAAIFNYSHYCIVEDLEKFLPVLIEELSRVS